MNALLFPVRVYSRKPLVLNPVLHKNRWSWSRNYSLKTCTHLSVYRYHRKQQQIWWSDVTQSGSLNWPDSWVLACISTASSPQSEWYEAALPGWMLSWSAVLIAPTLTEMSSGREEGGQKASTFTACPQRSTWSTCTKRQHVTEDTWKYLGKWEHTGMFWVLTVPSTRLICRICAFINWEGEMPASSPLPSQPLELTDKRGLLSPYPWSPGSLADADHIAAGPELASRASENPGSPWMSESRPTWMSSAGEHSPCAFAASHLRGQNSGANHETSLQGRGYSWKLP